MAEISLTSLLFQQSSFFALGGTNAISSIDLSNAYNGISGYNVLLVGILTFVSNWAGSIWWVSGTSILIAKNARESSRFRDASSADLLSFSATRGKSKQCDVPGSGFQEDQSLESVSFAHFSLLTLFTVGTTLSVMLACTFLREHLFVWTVFSPKYLYVGAWAFGHHFIINGLFGWGLLGRLSVT